MKWLNRIIAWIKGYKLLPHIPDPRDLHFRELILGEYKQKYPSRLLAPLFPENQYSLNCCSFESWANALSVYFGEPISVRYLTAKAWQQGLCQKYGGAVLKSGGQVARKFGIIFERDLPSYEDEGWDNFIKVDFHNLDPIALKNKIGSYYFLDTSHEILQALDEGYCVVLGRDFYVPSPFTSPWVIGRTGTKIGPHSTVAVGYKQDGVLLDALNSWGTGWGDKGHYYLSLGDIQQDIDRYGAIAITPIPYTPKDIKIKSLLELLKQLKDKIKNMITTSNILYANAYKYIGQNLAPEYQPTACSASVSFILRQAFDDDVRLASTTDLYNWLKTNPKFEEIQEAEKGAIIICPTSSLPDNSPLQGDKRHGHTAICGQYPAEDGSIFLMGNNPEKQVFDTHQTLKMFTDYFQTYAKGKIYMFRRLVV